MIDSVLKGTGNSRFLKSAVPAGTSWADALAMLQAGTFPIDFNGINAEGFQQVGTPLNKANLLKDATAAQIGLPPSTTPDGMFQALGNTGELHVWRKTEKVGSKGYYLDSVSSGRLSFVKNGAYVVTFSYSDTVSPNGALSGTVNTVSLSGTGDQTSKLSVLRGKFCRAESSGDSDSAFSGIIYIPNDATFTYKIEGLDYHSHYVDKKQTVVFTDAPTTTTYPVSTNPNAYQEGDDAKAAGYVVGDVVTGQFLISDKDNVSTSVAWRFGDDVTVADDGSTSLKDPSGDALDASNYESSRYDNKFKGKFVSVTKKSVGKCSFDNGIVYFIPNDAIISKITLTSVTFGQQAVVVDRYQPVTGYASIPAGTTIEYLGKLGDKARVQVVSYVGTGTYGESNPNMLQLPFEPKYVIVQCLSDYGLAFFAQGCTRTLSFRTSSGTKIITCSWPDAKTLKWYVKDSDYLQLNTSGVKYAAIIIG